MLVLEGLRKEYKNLTAVDEISFSVEPGKIFGLLGPNGAGKTTTIRMILNIIKPSSGTITYNGEIINHAFDKLTGYLPEERGLYKKSKVIDIIVYFGQLKGLSKIEAISNAQLWLKKLEIEDLKERKSGELSKGNQQKIQFIIATLHNPEVLILDEPFTGFDPVNQQLIKNIIVSLAQQGKIIILSTHQMDTAEKLCKQIFLINKGKEVLSGSIAEIKKKYASNTVRIEYENASDKISALPGVVQADVFNNYAEVQLENNIAPEQFLKTIINQISLKGFSIIEPSLNKIFIDEIKKDFDN
jgi:ABC-2 type transport system ATP-binding protein